MSSNNMQCPLCKSPSEEAKNRSLQNIVKDELKYLIIDESYFFCNSSMCEVVFFNSDYEKIFLLDDINLLAKLDEQSECGCKGNKSGCNKHKQNGCCGH